MIPKNPRPPARDQLLAALPGTHYKRLLHHLESVPLPFMDVLYESRRPITHGYFPDDGLISLLVVMGDETRRETGLIDNEGMLGTACASRSHIESGSITCENHKQQNSETARRFQDKNTRCCCQLGVASMKI